MIRPTKDFRMWPSFVVARKEKASWPDREQMGRRGGNPGLDLIKLIGRIGMRRKRQYRTQRIRQRFVRKGYIPKREKGDVCYLELDPKLIEEGN